jgi:hypothetical protein
VHIRSFLIPQAKATELVHPREGAFHDPAPSAQTAPVFRIAHCEERQDVASTQSTADFLRVIGPVSQYAIRAKPRPTTQALELSPGEAGGKPPTGFNRIHSHSTSNLWRLVLPVRAGKKLQNPPRFREGNTTLIPYVAYPFPIAAGVLPLVDVILGPGSHPSAPQAAFAFLTSEGIMVLPRESKVPYRPM